jgi:TPR repeat
VIRDYCLGNPRFAAKGNLLWGRILNDQGCPDEAIHRLNEAIIWDCNPINLCPLPKDGSREPAWLRAERIWRKKPPSARLLSIPNNARSYVHLGNALFAQQKYDAALKNYRKSIKVSPRFATPYRGKGDVFAAKGEYANTVSAYKWALYLNSKSRTFISHWPKCIRIKSSTWRPLKPIVTF